MNNEIWFWKSYDSIMILSISQSIDGFHKHRTSKSSTWFLQNLGIFCENCDGIEVYRVWELMSPFAITPEMYGCLDHWPPGHWWFSNEFNTCFQFINNISAQDNQSLWIYFMVAITHECSGYLERRLQGLPECSISIFYRNRTFEILVHGFPAPKAFRFQKFVQYFILNHQ